MATDKTDISNNIPSTGDVIQVQTGDTVEAEVENANNLLAINKIILSYNWIIDQGVQLNDSNTFGSTQTFGAGIVTDSIKSTTGTADVILNDGVFKYGGSDTSLELSTKLYVDQTVASAVITAGGNPFTGSGEAVAGTSGLVPEPPAATPRKSLRGDATFGNPLPLFATIQTTAFNFLPDYIYPIDTTAGAFTGTLPASPEDGARFGIKDVGRNTTMTNFTFGRNSKLMESVTGLVASDLVADISGATIILEYRASSGGYFVI